MTYFPKKAVQAQAIVEFFLILTQYQTTQVLFDISLDFDFDFDSILVHLQCILRLFFLQFFSCIPLSYLVQLSTLVNYILKQRSFVLPHPTMQRIVFSDLL